MERLSPTQTAFFQQVALNLEAVSNRWSTSAYLLYPIGEYGYNKMPARINDFYYADSVMTAGVDIGYNLTPNLKASVGYCYSEGDAGAANGNSVRGRLEYSIANGLTSGINIAYDPAFSEGCSSEEFYKTLNLSVDLKWRFGANGYGAPSIRKKQPVVMPVIQALSVSPDNRDVRVHDCSFSSFWRGGCNNKMREVFAPIIPVVVGAVSDLNSFKNPTSAANPVAGAGAVSGGFMNNCGGGLSSTCNGYIGRLIHEAMGNDCSKSLRSEIERVTGAYIPDDRLWREYRNLTWNDLANQLIFPPSEPSRRSRITSGVPVNFHGGVDMPGYYSDGP